MGTNISVHVCLGVCMGYVRKRKNVYMHIYTHKILKRITPPCDSVTRPMGNTGVKLVSLDRSR